MASVTDTGGVEMVSLALGWGGAARGSARGERFTQCLIASSVVNECWPYSPTAQVSSHLQSEGAPVVPFSSKCFMFSAKPRLGCAWNGHPQFRGGRSSRGHIAFPVYFSSSAPCSYPLCSVAPRIQLTPAPCCLVPSGAANTCPGYIPSYPYAVVGTSQYPNRELTNWYLLFPCCTLAVARALWYAVEQVGLAWEVGRASPSFSSPVSVLKGGEWEADRLSLVPPPSISPLLYSLPFSSFSPLTSIIHTLFLLLPSHSCPVSLQKAFLPLPRYSSSSPRIPPRSLIPLQTPYIAGPMAQECLELTHAQIHCSENRITVSSLSFISPLINQC